MKASSVHYAVGDLSVLIHFPGLPQIVLASTGRFGLLVEAVLSVAGRDRRTE